MIFNAHLNEFGENFLSIQSSLAHLIVVGALYRIT